MNIANGTYVKSVFSSADATTAAPLVLTDMDGNTYTVAAGNRLVLTNIVIVSGQTVTLFQDMNGDGLVTAGDARIVANTPGSNTTYVAEGYRMVRQPTTLANGLLKVLAGGAGQVNITVIGFVVAQ